MADEAEQASDRVRRTGLIGLAALLGAAALAAVDPARADTDVAGTTSATHGRTQLVKARHTHAEGTGNGVSSASEAHGRPAPGQPDRSGNVVPTETITVSANKRRQRTRDVAGSVTVLPGRQLEALGAQGFASYLQLAPGAVFSEGIPGLSTVAFRGVTDTNLLDQGQGTTGYFLNDIPLTEPGFAITIPDIDTFDVNRVEVLRGPQSTLFGSATLGGAVDYIANTADPYAFDAAAESTVLGTQGHEVGYSEKVMVNQPIIADQLAVRGVLEYRQDPGYNSNIGVGATDTNQDVIRNARVSVTWQANDTTKFTYLFLAQNNAVSDQGYSQPAYGQYVKNTLIFEPYYTSTQLHSLRLDESLSFGTLTAQAAFLRKDEFLGADDTPYYAGTVDALTPYSAPQTGDSKSMYYEIRLTSHNDLALTWLAGAAYYRVWKRIDDLLGTPGAETALAAQYGPALAAAEAPDGSDFSEDIGDYDGSEEAAFGEASYHFLHDYTFTFGGRLYWTSQTDSEEDIGLFTDEAYGAPFHALEGATSDNGFLPKISFRYEPSRTFMAYGLISEGFRFGQPNINPVDPSFPTPAGTASDTLINYEVGLRVSDRNNVVLFEPTLFWIDWDDIQARLTRPDGITYGANVGDAVSRGAEITTAVNPLPGLRLQSNVTYLDAHLTQGIAIGDGVAPILAGTALPAASKWQFSEILSYTFDSRFKPQVSVVHHYISSARGALDTDFMQGDYNTVDLRLTGQWRKASLTFFITNLTNSAGVTSGGIYGSTAQEEQYFLLRPRTFGATVAWHY